ncbi:MAG: hypothetical protein QM638_05820 [Nocardioides sp.]|uniref:hypothetical protein n=1 Tax=Nocardioides sp. TaxID=35761 RepID=UPI0039E725D6
MSHRAIALTAAGTVLAGSVVATSATAFADGPERHASGTIGKAHYDIEIEKEKRYEVSVDLDGVAKGSTWKLRVRHDGRLITKQKRTAERDDGRYEVDFRDVGSRNTSGKDTFTVTILRAGGGKAVRTLVFSR